MFFSTYKQLYWRIQKWVTFIKTLRNIRTPFSITMFDLRQTEQCLFFFFFFFFFFFTVLGPQQNPGSASEILLNKYLLLRIHLLDCMYMYVFIELCVTLENTWFLTLQPNITDWNGKPISLFSRGLH